MVNLHRRRRQIVILIALLLFAAVVVLNFPKNANVTTGVTSTKNNNDLAINVLAKIAIKGRASKTNYSRSQFGGDWKVINGCDTRNIILNRDMTDVILDEKCHVIGGVLDDPYTGKIINFERGSNTSGVVQIDHVVALSDAWQKGAQQLTALERENLANDPLVLLAVDGTTNQNKSDGDAATWLPPNKAFRCQYVARQIAIKLKYNLWMTQAEHNTIEKILGNCPGQKLPVK